MENAIFWDVALCISYVKRRFGGTYRLHLQGTKIRERETNAATCSHWFLPRGFFYPEDGDDTFLRNVGSHKIYTASHPRRWHFSNRSYIRNMIARPLILNNVLWISELYLFIFED
jgi:hypothetical protein